MTEDKDSLLKIYLQEYDKLKAEQIARIGFRDNLLYVTLGLFGAILSFALPNKSYHAFLLIPWICLILGWTYLVNDEKINALGRYIRYALVEKVSQEIQHPIPELIFGWEIAHRSDSRRQRRKIIQLMIDEITFVVSGLLALIFFRALLPQTSIGIQILCVLEGGLLVFLGIEMVVYADLARGR